MPIAKDSDKMNDITKAARRGSGLSLSVLDLQAIRKLLENETGGATCPSCQMPFDKGKKRKLIDNCGHERCYSCMFKMEACPVCIQQQQQCTQTDDAENNEIRSSELTKLHDYDTGLGGSTTDATARTTTSATTANAKTNGYYMQTRSALTSPTPSEPDQNHQQQLQQQQRQPKQQPSLQSSRPLTMKPPVLKHHQPQPQLADVTVHSAATPPPNRRRLFNTKNLRSPFGQRRPSVATTNSSSAYTENASTFSDDEGGNVKPVPLGGANNKSKSSHDELQLRLGFFLRNNAQQRGGSVGGVGARNSSSSGSGSSVRTSAPAQSYSSLASANTSPVSTLTGSSEADVSRVMHHGHNVINGSSSGGSSSTGTNANGILMGTMYNNAQCESIGSMMSVSMSGNSGGDANSSSASPLTSRRHSVTTTAASQAGQQLGGGATADELAMFKATATTPRKATVRRSVRTAPLKSKCATDDPRARFAQQFGAACNGAAAGDASAACAAPAPVAQLTLRPLFFEVPQQEPDPVYVGRDWLLQELSGTIAASATPGILIDGHIGTGKTALILQLVEYSCFGRRGTRGTGGADTEPSAPSTLGKNSSAIATASSDLDSIVPMPVNSSSTTTSAQDRIRALASHVVAYHFCQADNNITCLVPDFIHSVAAQLCQAPQLANYRDYLLAEPHLQNILSVKECIADPERALKMGILEPLTILRRTGKLPARPAVILVDALCEAEYHRPDHGDTIATFLARMTEHFPAWMRVITTVRTPLVELVKRLPYTRLTLNDAAAEQQQHHQMLHAASSAGGPITGPLKDIGDYITFRVGHSSSIQTNCNPPDTRTTANHHNGISSSSAASSKDSAAGHLKFMQYLLSIAHGSFLFAKLSLDLIERGYLVIKSSSYNVLPVSLAEIYLLHFNLRFPTAAAYAKVAPILNVCLAALYPLTLTEIYCAVCSLSTGGPDDEDTSAEESTTASAAAGPHATAASLSGSKPSLAWDEFLFRFKQLTGFLVRRLDDTYMFFHPSFREWLMRRDEGDSCKFVCDLRAGHAAIAFRLSRVEQPLDDEQALEMGHHILKAHVYRAHASGAPQTPAATTTTTTTTPRDLQSYWLASVTRCVSSALGTLRNVYSPNLKVSRLLLLAGAAPDHVTPFMGRAPILCIAAHEGNVPMVRLLLEFGADVEAANSQGCTPLILAAANGHCDVVRQLVAAGSVPGHGDVAQRCALVHAARMNKAVIVKYLVACDWQQRMTTEDEVVGAGADVRLSDAAQHALIAAAAEGNVAIVEDLMDMDEIRMDGWDTLQGETALTAAARNGRTETVQVLVSRGAMLDRMNKRGETALLLAVREGHWAVAERLLQSHADAELMDAAGKTALIVAAEEGHVGIIELLVNRGAALGAQDLEGLSALSWACLRGRLQAAKCLAERGADVHHVDRAGRTPLDLAAYQGSAALVQMLLDRGVRIEHVDVNGMRPLDRAIACRNMQVVQVFLKRGAKLGPTTWTMAAGKPEIMLLLLNKLLEDGNILYRKNRLQEAAHRYQYALRKIPVPATFAEHAGTFLQLKVNFLLNHSRCKRKMNEFAEAVALAAQAIELRPDNYEGYYARSKAYMELDRIDEALFDARMALERCSAATLDIKKILVRLLDDLTQRSAAMADAAAAGTSEEYDDDETVDTTDL